MLTFKNQGINVSVYSEGQKIANFNKTKKDGFFRLKYLNRKNSEYTETSAKSFEQCKTVFALQNKPKKRYVNVVSSTEYKNQAKKPRKMRGRKKNSNFKRGWENQKNHLSNYKPENKGLFKESDGLIYAGGIKPKA